MRIILAALLGCTETVVEATTGESFQEQIERECKEAGLTCTLVRAFEARSESHDWNVELCIMPADIALAEAMHGKSRLTDHERFDDFYALGILPNCIWCAGFGCNAKDGCFNCPEM